MKNNTRKPSILRLVASSKNATHAQSAIEETPMPVLSSTNSSMRTVVLMREVEIEKNGSFADFARKFRPRCILDFRFSPRLDFFAGSRVRAFKLFDELHVEYLDIFGRAGINTNRSMEQMDDAFLKSLDHYLSNLETDGRPIILFFDNEDLLRQCKKILPYAFTAPNTHHTQLNITEYKSGFLSVQTG
ncbi:hypothetical protein [Pseudomonas sp. ACM7]|uniref:hypothetical protein n=1 Tax=Pseudomonas sp. ACM7 TaxID=2052956 RepID=UPI0010124CF3|nr:hypothetical protein [Pseudomonas sp. ACM7]